MIPPVAEAWAVLGLRLVMAGALLAFVFAVLAVARRELAALAAAATPTPTAGDRVHAALGLVLLDGGSSRLHPGTSWPLASGATIGRRPDNAVAIDDRFLSGIHAEVVHEAGSWWVRDRGSTNGTLLNGRPVTTLTAIRAGDVLQFGGIRLQAVPGESSPGVVG